MGQGTRVSRQEAGLCPPWGGLSSVLCPQVSHHPPVSAFHVSNRKDGFCISGNITAKSRFYGEGAPLGCPSRGMIECRGPQDRTWWPALSPSPRLRVRDHVGGEELGTRREAGSVQSPAAPQPQGGHVLRGRCEGHGQGPAPTGAV